MSFYGENNLFSFRDNICEQITKEPLTVSQLAEFGSKVNFNGKIIAPLIFLPLLTLQYHRQECLH